MSLTVDIGKLIHEDGPVGSNLDGPKGTEIEGWSCSNLLVSPGWTTLEIITCKAIGNSLGGVTRGGLICAGHSHDMVNQDLISF